MKIYHHTWSRKQGISFDKPITWDILIFFGASDVLKVEDIEMFTQMFQPKIAIEVDVNGFDTDEIGGLTDILQAVKPVLTLYRHLITLP
jgi:hypothetical protein